MYDRHLYQAVTRFTGINESKTQFTGMGYPVPIRTLVELCVQYSRGGPNVDQRIKYPAMDEWFQNVCKQNHGRRRQFARWYVDSTDLGMGKLKSHTPIKTNSPVMNFDIWTKPKYDVSRFNLEASWIVSVLKDATWSFYPEPEKSFFTRPYHVGFWLSELTVTIAKLLRTDKAYR